MTCHFIMKLQSIIKKQIIHIFLIIIFKMQLKNFSYFHKNKKLIFQIKKLIQILVFIILKMECLNTPKNILIKKQTTTQ